MKTNDFNIFISLIDLLVKIKVFQNDKTAIITKGSINNILYILFYYMQHDIFDIYNMTNIYFDCLLVKIMLISYQLKFDAEQT